MKSYELTYYISREVAEEEARKISEEISSFIQTEGNGRILSESLSIQSLAYPIKNQTEAYSVILNLYCQPEKIEELRKKLEKNSKVLRLLFVSKPPEKTVVKKETVKTGVLSAEPKKEQPEKKVELQEIEKKLEEILGE